jgi:Uma2 family endonuclease
MVPIRRRNLAGQEHRRTGNAKLALVSGPARYVVDPHDPRAPPQRVWDELSEIERARLVASLPSEVPLAEPPEGDQHRIPKARALEALSEYFRRLKRRVYLSSELPVYYPSEAMFAPDILAVLDVDAGPRERWVVSAEGRGLDLALEICVRGDRKKDFIDNVDRFARLGIPEYFAYDPVAPRLSGFRLEQGRYRSIEPRSGRWESNVLGLELAMESGRIRFFHGTAPLPEAEELIERLGSMVDDIVKREEALASRLERERERADSAEQRAERLAARLRQLGVDPDN